MIWETILTTILTKFSTNFSLKIDTLILTGKLEDVNSMVLICNERVQQLHIHAAIVIIASINTSVSVWLFVDFDNCVLRANKIELCLTLRAPSECN